MIQLGSIRGVSKGIEGNSHSYNRSTFVFVAVLMGYLFRQWPACVRVPIWKNNVLGVSAVEDVYGDISNVHSH